MVTGLSRSSIFWLAVLSPLLGCSDQNATNLGEFIDGADGACSIPASEIFNGGPGKDGIPALTNPRLVGPEDSEASYLRNEDRVMGFMAGDQVLAIPLNILWWHEIVNLDLPGLRVAVTHCPLTGSSMIFDRAAVAGAELGVSGLLFQNNLIMYDRTSAESLWPQMMRGARCGPASGTTLPMAPVMEMTWEGWRTLHPETRVVSSATGFSRDYRVYPYGDYGRVGNNQLLFPMSEAVDRRRPLKERVLGVPAGEGGRAYPFGELASLGVTAVVQREEDAVFWDGLREAAMAFRTTLGGNTLTFSLVGGKIVDQETGSVWRVDGEAVSGPLAGQRLTPVSDAYVAYWFAWAAFHPETELWSAS